MPLHERNHGRPSRAARGTGSGAHGAVTGTGRTSLERTAEGTTGGGPCFAPCLSSSPQEARGAAGRMEEFAAARRGEGVAAEVVMDLEQDAFLVVVPQQYADRGR